MTSPRNWESLQGLNPTVGQLVVTRDGHKLGHVKELGGHSFKVDAPRKGDYWLSLGFVLKMSDEQIEMDFDEEMLKSYKLEAPLDRVISESPYLEAAAETFSSQEELDRRREEQIHGGRPSGTA